MANIKIAMIGGGSAFCPVVLSALIGAPGVFNNSQLILMDIHEENLNIVHSLGVQMVRAAGINLDIRKTTNRREAIDGADFILTSFRPGGFEARSIDEKIPLKYGIIGQETVGPGGFFMAMRSVEIIRGIVSEMEELAPNAFLLNYTNPTNIVTEAVLHNSSINIIGLCDQSQGDRRRLADALDMDVSRIEYEACGLNHATWSTLFKIDGLDGIPRILDKAIDIESDPKIPTPVKRMFRLVSWFERIPNRYMQYYFFHEEMLQEALRERESRAEMIMGELPIYFEHYREESRKKIPDVVRMRGGTKAFGDYAIDVIRAIVEDSGKKFILNVHNQNSIPGFDDDRVVEVPCIVDRIGAHPIRQAPMSHEGLAPIKMLAEYQALTSRVAWHGNRRDAIRALASNPLVLTLSKAEALVDEMVKAHRKYLPSRLL
jgi:6-phospho-beta-glucosidase